MVFPAAGAMQHSSLKDLLEGHENGTYPCQRKRIPTENVYFELHLEEYVASPAAVMLHGNIKTAQSPSDIGLDRDSQSQWHDIGRALCSHFQDIPGSSRLPVTKTPDNGSKIYRKITTERRQNNMMISQFVHIPSATLTYVLKKKENVQHPPKIFKISD